MERCPAIITKEFYPGQLMSGTLKNLLLFGIEVGRFNESSTSVSEARVCNILTSVRCLTALC